MDWKLTKKEDCSLRTRNTRTLNEGGSGGGRVSGSVGGAGGDKNILKFPSTELTVSAFRQSSRTFTISSRILCCKVGTVVARCFKFRCFAVTDL